ncbi:hypothetical protein [Pontibacter vulgaris]|uniref:hypothetical protein n=1 Tax=Pontibacter vulgaris TaxID=2905679 RepID=UPI001FA6C60D|nr:hypothetical protein [Pontibacter vulgaris]
MTEKPQIVNNIHAATLIGAGLSSYFLNKSRPKTALIPPAVGGSLLLLSNGLKKGNKSVAHVAVLETAALLVQTTRMFLQAAMPNEETEAKLGKQTLQRRSLVFGLMSITGLAAVSIYVAGFIEKRRKSY